MHIIEHTTLKRLKELISPLLPAHSVLYWIAKGNPAWNTDFFFFFNACPFSRPGHLGLTRRAATMGSIAPPPTPKVIRATSHTTRATARRGKMCETLHKKTSADRGDLAYPPPPHPHPHPHPCLQLTDSPVPLLLPDSSSICLSVKLFGDDEQRFLAGIKKKRRKKELL